ncbi:hypothetical protein Q5752_004384 [Cryptotrichosporon argae]
MQSLPLSHVLAAHGLYDSDLHVPFIAEQAAELARLTAYGSARPIDAAWRTGWARLEPTDDYPLLPGSSSARDRPVHFYFCPAGDANAATHFRRHAQVLAIDEVAAKILAWWEDEHGLWLVTDESRWSETTLLGAWRDIVGDDWPGQPIRDQAEASADWRGSIAPRNVWAEACELFVQVLEALNALHDKNLSLNWAHPASFTVRPLDHGPADPPKVCINRLWDVTAIAGFNLSVLLDSAPIGQSLLFARDAIDQSSSNLSEAYILGHLRYLSPESAVTRVTSPSNDVYGWGVLAYELLTGTTIDGGPDSPDMAGVDLLADIHRHVTVVVPSPLECLQRAADIASVPAKLPPQQLSDIVMLALAKDPVERYQSFDALAFDLRKLGQICRSAGDLGKFAPGAVDRMSRFRLPPVAIDRSKEMQALNATFELLCRDRPGSTPRVVNIWGPSGYGKSRVVDDWARQIEAGEQQRPVLVGSAKLDEHLSKPLSSFVQVFHSLLDRVLTDPREDAANWIDQIRSALGSQYGILLSLLSQEARRLLRVENFQSADIVDLENFLAAFKLWARRFLQLFATPQRPLILIVDDTQWMIEDEVKIWRDLLDGANSLCHVFVLFMTRTQDERPPPTSALLSIASTSLPIGRLTEDGVTEFIATCFNRRLASNAHAAASMIYGETNGSPLFLRTLLSTLVRNKVAYFDFETLVWVFDNVALQSHLFDAGVDAYIDRLLGELSVEVRQMLMTLSCLPSAGVPLTLLAASIDKTPADISSLLAVASAAGTIVANAREVRFTHDRQKSAAQRLIAPHDAGRMHQHVSLFLRRPDLINDYLFDSVEHALTARALGAPAEDEATMVSLLLDAATRAALSASFSSAQHFINVAQQVIDETGGIATWMQRHRALYFRYIEKTSEIGSVLRIHVTVLAKLDAVLAFCATRAEEIRMVTLIVRLLVTASRHQEALSRFWSLLAKLGYDSHAPTAVSLWYPQTVEDVEEFGKEIEANGDADDSHEYALIAELLSFTGPTLYITYGLHSDHAFILGMSVLRALDKSHSSMGYLLALHAMTVAMGAFGSMFTPLDQIAVVMDAAFTNAISQGDYEIGCYVLVLDSVHRLLSHQPCDWDVIAKRYDAVRQFASGAHRVSIHIAMQYAENLAKDRPDAWEMDGAFITRADIEAVAGLGLQAGFDCMFTLRAQILYDAPLDVQLAAVQRAMPCVSAVAGLAAGLELHFVMAVVAIRTSSHQEIVDEAFAQLGRYDQWSVLWARRTAFLRALILVEADPLGNLAEAEKAVELLEADESDNVLCGLLNYLIADAIRRATGSDKLATGFIRAAFASYRSAEQHGLCQMLKRRFPNTCPALPAATVLPSQRLGVVVAPPVLRRASVSTSNETTVSNRSKDTDEANASAVNDSLDALTLMRTSLALAQEKEPNTLLCTLLRILCQSVRCDYAAIALCDDDEPTLLRLRAAGPFQRIVAYDLDVTDEIALSVCPSTVMLHVSRSGTGISAPERFPRLRHEPFYSGRQPRTILCLPVVNRGTQAGVILLSSATNTLSAAQLESFKEVVSALATFAFVSHSHLSFAQRLKAQVAQRTRQLSDALQAKTQFLSQCSHELRSPLAAIMGLAAVLEASPSLSAVQREHLRTITTSSEDLLALISNILDHSKLESNSVELEHIPLSLRDVVEAALDTIVPAAQSKGIEVSLTTGFLDDPPGLLGDPFRIKQVLLNLLSNAVKFTPPMDEKYTRQTPRVTVYWEWTEVDGSIKVSLHVQDTGVGIPASKLHKLFKSFSQVDESITRSYGGSGLGLIISRDLARLFGGDCTVESDYGKGSTFTFSLVAKRDPSWAPVALRRLATPQSCFVVCPSDQPWVTCLEKDLEALNCRPIRFVDDMRHALVQDYPNGLNSRRAFAFVIVDATMVNANMLQRMKELQPNAQFVFLVRAIDLTTEMTRLGVERRMIVARPIKFKSLYETIIPLDQSKPGPSPRTPIGKRGINRKMASEKPLKILVVDDSAVNVSVCCRILELFGYKDVDSASDGLQAAEAADKTRYDLILLDLQMPVLDGFGALGLIQASPLAGDPCCVSLSANVDKATQERCLASGFFSSLTKPVDIPRLGDILATVYAQKQAGGMRRAEDGLNGMGETAEAAERNGGSTVMKN